MADDKDVGGDAPQEESVMPDAVVPEGGESAAASYPLLPVVPEVRRFDYSKLDLPKTVRTEIANTAVEIRSAMRRTLDDWKLIGSRLAWVKDRLPHGAWLPFLELEFGLSDRHARNFMTVAAFISRKEAEVFSDLPPSTVAVLATAPTPVQEEVAGRLRRGERPSFTEIRDLAKHTRSSARTARRTSDDRPSPTAPRKLPEHLWTPVDGEEDDFDTETIEDHTNPPDDPDLFIPLHDVGVTLDTAAALGLEELAADWGVSPGAAVRRLLEWADESYTTIPPPLPTYRCDRRADLADQACRMRVRYVSFFSGIEAALSVAADRHRWDAAAVCQYEPPSKAPEKKGQYAATVLTERLPPSVANLGDVTGVQASDLRGVEVMVGGSPCQAFSADGLRRGVMDPRGMLTHTFVTLATKADCRVSREGIQGVPVLLWENVPNVLALHYLAPPPKNAGKKTDGANFDDRQDVFGSVLAVLSGAYDRGTVIPRPRTTVRNRRKGTERIDLESWPRAGYVAGPTRLLAWAVLDPVAFGLPQARERVYLVACRRGDGLDPREMLWERPPALDRPYWSENGTTVWLFDGVRTGPAVPASPGTVRAALAAAFVRTGIDRTGDAASTEESPAVPPSGSGKRSRRPKGGQPQAARLAALRSIVRKTGEREYDPGEDVQEHDVPTATYHGNAQPETGHEADYLIAPEQAANILANVGRKRNADRLAPWVRTLLGAVHEQGAVLPLDAILFKDDERQAFEEAMAWCADAVLLHWSSKGGDLTVRTGADKGHMLTLKAKAGSGPAERSLVVRRDGDRVWVRTMMPVEGERLMGVPDGWTQLRKWDGGSADGETKRRKSRASLRAHAENARFFVLGNSLMVGMMDWLVGRIDAAIRRAAADGAFRPERGAGIRNHFEATKDDARRRAAQEKPKETEGDWKSPPAPNNRGAGAQGFRMWLRAQAKDMTTDEIRNRAVIWPWWSKVLAERTVGDLREHAEAVERERTSPDVPE